MKKKIIIGVLAVILLVGGVIVFRNGNAEEKAKQATAEPEEKAAAEKELDSVDVYGTVESKEKRSIRLDAPAKIEGVHIEEGEEVENGTKLMTFDLQEAKTELAAKRQKLDQVETELESLEEQFQLKREKIKNQLAAEKEIYHQQQKQLERLEEELAAEDSPDFKKLAQKLSAARREYKRSQEKLKKKQKLLEQEAVTESEVEEMEAALKQKKEAVEEIKLSIEELSYKKERELEDLKSSFISQEQQLEQLKIELAELKLNRKQDYKAKQAEVAELKNQVKKLAAELEADYLQEDQLVADWKTGVVYDIGYQVGDSINQEQPLLRVMSTEELVVEVEVPEEFIKDISLGAKATIVPLADSSREYEGEVTRIANKAVDKDVETVVPVEISIADQDEFLLPNFNVDVAIEPDQN